MNLIELMIFIGGFTFIACLIEVRCKKILGKLNLLSDRVKAYYGSLKTDLTHEIKLVGDSHQILFNDAYSKKSVSSDFINETIDKYLEFIKSEKFINEIMVIILKTVEEKQREARFKQYIDIPITSDLPRANKNSSDSSDEANENLTHEDLIDTLEEFIILPDKKELEAASEGDANRT